MIQEDHQIHSGEECLAGWSWWLHRAQPSAQIQITAAEIKMEKSIWFTSD